MKKIDFKKFVPHLIALVVFFAVTIAYFAPIFFEGKDLAQGDVTSYLGWGNDVREYVRETGEYCYWSNAMFGGMPSNYAYPAPTNNIFKQIQHLLTGFLPFNTAGAFFVYMIGFYIFLLVIGCNSWLSIVGALAYALCSYNIIIIDAGHVSKALVMTTMAPIVGGIILCYRKKYISGVIITLIATGMNVFWNHQQISYYLILSILCLAIVYLVFAIKEKTLKDYLKSSVILIVVAILAAAPAVDKLIPTIDFSKETMRGGAVLQSNAEGEKESTGLDIDYAYQWSYGKAETMTLLIPNFYGASSHYNLGQDSETYEALRQTGQAKQFCRYAPMYWGDQPFTSGPVYAGAIICFLFVLGLIICKGPERWWMLAATIIAIILSWGRNLPSVNEWLFHNLPLYNKFRTPSMSLVVVNFTMAALGIMAIKQIIETEDKRFLLKPLYISVGVVAGLCLLFALFGGSMFDFKAASDAQLPAWLHSALIQDRKDMLTSDAWRSFIFIALSAIAIWLYLYKGYKSLYMILIVGLLCFIDLWGVDKRFVNEDSFSRINKNDRGLTPSAIDAHILKDTDPNYRVLNLSTNTFNESRTSYYHKSIGGYSPVKLRRYQDIIDYHISRQITPNVLDMLNTRYIIFNTEQGPRVQRQPSAMGNAWFVENIEWQETPDAEIMALSTFNPRTTALIHNEWRDKIQNESVLQGVDTTAVISLVEYANPGYLIYESQSSKPQLAVFSEVHYKTWRAYIDGVEMPILRVNYLLRALEIPAGKHRIEFKCVDELYETTHIWSLVASIIVVLLVLTLAGLGLYRKLKSNQ